MSYYVLLYPPGKNEPFEVPVTKVAELKLLKGWTSNPVIDSGEPVAPAVRVFDEDRPVETKRPRRRRGSRPISVSAPSSEDSDTA